MKILSLIILVIFISASSSCDNNAADKKGRNSEVFAKEPDDSANYAHLKYDFYSDKDGHLYERKLVFADGEKCDCQFLVFYDEFTSISRGDSTVKVLLDSVIDINSFVAIDSTEFSKDRHNVYYFHGNSDGGNRTIVKEADPGTFKRLCEYRWGIDKNFVFFMGDCIKELDINNVQILYSPDSSDTFIDYVKDSKNVFYGNKVLKGADPATFKVVTGQQWDAEDKNNKYYNGH